MAHETLTRRKRGDLAPFSASDIPRCALVLRLAAVLRHASSMRETITTRT